MVLFIAIQVFCLAGPRGGRPNPAVTSGHAQPAGAKLGAVWQHPHFLLFLPSKRLPRHGQTGAPKPLSEARGLVEEA